MAEIDESYEIAKAIFEGASKDLANIKSEEDAKLKIITRVLTDALGWGFEDISAEHHNENGFSDYIVSDGDHDAFVVEAKKVGVIGITTHALTMQKYKISGPALKEAARGIAQAAAYASPLGIQLGVLTDGVTWVVFLPHIPGGRYQEKQAIVFPTFESVLNDFNVFYELISKTECRKNTYKIIFDNIHENRLVQTASLVPAIPLSEIHVQPKSALAFDLEGVFAKFFSNLAGDDDPDLLINCFVETRESRVADFSLERITANVLGNLEPAEKPVDEGLHSVIETTIEAGTGQTVFIVGPSGAGKSTFLDRFFKKTLPPLIRSRCVVISINALDATGDPTTAIPSMTNRVISLIEDNIFTDGIPEWDNLLGLYHLEYLKRLKGVDADLYAADKPAFKRKFAGIVEDLVENDREGYLLKLLRDVVSNRNKLPIFVVDNTDEFDISYKEKVFQYFQSLSRSAKFCLLIFPVTDKSAWSFSKTDIFNIYSSKSFFLPTPSPREVFRKRVDYLKDKINTQSKEKTESQYLVGQGIKLKITDLSAFASVVENIFVDQGYSSKRVGELSNYNMRKTLKLSKRVITSSVLGIDDIVKSYFSGEIVTPSAEKFMNALLKGDYSHFRRDDDHEIFPMFEVDINIRQSPLIHLRILILLRDAHIKASEETDRHINVKSIYSYFDLMSFSEVAVEKSLIYLLESKLIEPFDLSMKGYSQDQRIAITHSGLAHVDLAMANSTYFEQMALTTRITNADVAAQIRGAYHENLSLQEKMENVRRLFATYLIDEDLRFGAVPDRAEFALQRTLVEDVRARWCSRFIDVPILGDANVAEGVIATVEKFDHSKGFGFASVEGLQEDAFLHIRVADSAGFDVHDGDDLLCDLSKNAKGYYISAIHDVVTPPSKIFTGRITRLFNERGYGFVYVPELGADAFFHYSIFDRDVQSNLSEGMTLNFEVKTDAQGRHQVRKLAEGSHNTLSVRSAPVIQADQPK
ncbi:cold shock domain-containing protein [Afifella sp. JA880]|uniref:cold shock domain-containing protein n=1 Tax=Afifella sp. JA880 TaxID=2975280 RepID=UPI0021BAE2E3|nr:cold shock domain-containing protein [Afifella sp. JA880]MCT8266861.1 cold shock domain-containing protein [Afifella sp. JA880]